LHPHGFIDPDKEYKVKSIVGEDESHYKIKWEDDEGTGESYKDSWEPKINANQEAIDDWERQKAEKASKQLCVLCSLDSTDCLRDASPDSSCSRS
jgi:hypothetical protein